MDKAFVADALDRNLGTDGVGLQLVESLDVAQTRFSKGDYIHHAGDPINAVYCIHEGWATSVIDFVDGTRQLMNFYVPVDIIGLEHLSSTTANSDMVASENTAIFSIPVSKFNAALRSSDAAQEAVRHLLSVKYASLQRRMCVIAHANAGERVADFLVSLRAKQKRNGLDNPDLIRLPLTQQDIADTLGLNHITVNRAFKQLEGAGIIEYSRGRTEVLDADRLFRIVERFGGRDTLAEEFG